MCPWKPRSGFSYFILFHLEIRTFRSFTMKRELPQHCWNFTSFVTTKPIQAIKCTIVCALVQTWNHHPVSKPGNNFTFLKISSIQHWLSNRTQEQQQSLRKRQDKVRAKKKQVLQFNFLPMPGINSNLSAFCIYTSAELVTLFTHYSLLCGEMI